MPNEYIYAQHKHEHGTLHCTQCNFHTDVWAEADIRPLQSHHLHADCKCVTCCEHTLTVCALTAQHNGLESNCEKKINEKWTNISIVNSFINEKWIVKYVCCLRWVHTYVYISHGFHRRQQAKWDKLTELNDWMLAAHTYIQMRLHKR